MEIDVPLNEQQYHPIYEHDEKVYTSMEEVYSVFQQHDDSNQQYPEENFQDLDQRIQYYYDYERMDWMHLE